MIVLGGHPARCHLLDLFARHVDHGAAMAVDPLEPLQFLVFNDAGTSRM
jgi:hypothetical protein